MSHKKEWEINVNRAQFMFRAIFGLLQILPVSPCQTLFVLLDKV